MHSALQCLLLHRYCTRWNWSTVSKTFQNSTILSFQHGRLGRRSLISASPNSVPAPSMKRKAENKTVANSPAKKVKAAEYCDIPTRKDEDGNDIWPAPREQIEAAREFLKDCATAGKKTLVVPDKDADGLSAGVLVQRTLVALGHDPNLIHVHLIQKGSNVHDAEEKRLIAEKQASFVIVLDQGSRKDSPLVDPKLSRCLLIDHHLSDDFPEHALVVSGCHSPPVPTTALMAYEICKALHPSVEEEYAYLCVIGTHGDLGTSLKWLPPFPDLDHMFKRHSKKILNDCVSYINAPRRTGKYDVISAWKALLDARDPKEVLSNRRLAEARFEINDEVERRTHTPPKFSKDGKIAVLKIDSKAQVHPVIATRWASHLKSKALEIVMVANYGYLPDRVNFSCRIAKCARDRNPPVNIIESLKAAASLDDGDLRERLGDSFARGHKEASGGIVPTAEFDELYALLKVGEKPEKPAGQESKKAVGSSPQKNTLANYFKAAGT